MGTSFCRRNAGPRRVPSCRSSARAGESRGRAEFTPCYCVLSSILVGLGFIRMLCFNSLSRGMPESIIK